ncbi:saccharopine dehydrogenase NADP-binding domain-containing protein [Streptomyces profundus]|uniref:saccharopine dehydrogenase NADP-binding domain-containing protein n=1 Tax=Streptomyces profundus TaxID=2867410 RepID=UPI001D163D9F|nr:saccharopine dehydrogenase NADP-binding domain-containing protein [Streptomyces sp. MA3_2.13]UED88033.1 saccharopine dehydrogenase NADP-binding domain-containing protein [Streptomyces sp. MA3_2.13]
MSAAPGVGLLGGSGAVGRQVAARLRARGVEGVLVGGRDVAAAEAVVGEVLGGAGRAVGVHVEDPASLRDFVADRAVVVNCAGPSRRIMDRVAVAALRAGAGYVDVGGDDPLYAAMTRPGAPAPTVPVVLSAGMVPGLTGLLPRYLAGRGFTAVDRLTVYHGVRDRIGWSGAFDLVTGILDGVDESFAAWRSGAPRSGALGRAVDTALPGFAEPVTAHPYLSPEGVRTAARLGLGEGTWYSVLFDGRTSEVLGSLPALTGADAAPAAERLARAADFDMLGRVPQVTLLCQLDGRGPGGTMTRSLVLRAGGAAELVAATAAATVEQVLRGGLPAGVCFAGEALDPAPAVAALARDPGVTRLTEHDVPLEELLSLDEGVF